MAHIEKQEKDLGKLHAYNANIVAGYMEIEIKNLEKYKNQRQNSQIISKQKSLIRAIQDIYEGKSFR